LYGKTGVVAVRVAHAVTLALLVPDNIKHAAGPCAQDLADNIQGGAFHFRSKAAGLYPGFPLVHQFITSGHTVGAMLTIEGILALHNSGMPLRPQFPGGFNRSQVVPVMGMHLTGTVNCAIIMIKYNTVIERNGV